MQSPAYMRAPVITLLAMPVFARPGEASVHDSFAVTGALDGANEDAAPSCLRQAPPSQNGKTASVCATLDCLWYPRVQNSPCAVVLPRERVAKTGSTSRSTRPPFTRGPGHDRPLRRALAMEVSFQNTEQVMGVGEGHKPHQKLTGSWPRDL